MLLAGWARADITPQVGVDLCGFGSRAGPSEGVHDPLLATALCLSDKKERAAVVTADLIGLDAGTVAEVRGQVRERLGAEAPDVMIACSHTHSGPSTPCLPFLGRPDPQYMARLKETLVEIVVEASSELRLALLAFGRAPVQVGINRRERAAQGHIVLGRNVSGLIAPYVDVMVVHTDGHKIVFFSHAAHPVTLGADNLLISADWPGYARRFVEEALGDNCITMYGQGCCGDINSDPRGTFDVAEEQGKKVARAVLEAIAAVKPSPNGMVRVLSETVELPLSPPPPIEEARAILASAEQDRHANAATDNYGMRMMREGVVEWAMRLVELAEARAGSLTQPFEIQALRIGSGAIVGLPGEVFVAYQHQIGACSPLAPTIVLGYANGNVGYVPTEQAFQEGGYEVDTAIRYYGTTMLMPTCEHLIVERACQLLERL